MTPTSSGEVGLIERLAAVLGPAGPGVSLGIGDDAAVVAPDLVWAVDLLVEDVHFRASTAGESDVGWKALAVNLSDLAAMGAAPVAALVGLVLPPDRPPAAVEEIYRGLRACGDAYGCPVVGGDLSRGPALMLAVTVLGRAASPARRDGARPGDVLAVTGALGGSEAGRLLIEGRVAPVGVDADGLALRHRRPRPRLADGARLAPHVHAMLDVSDGVASDAARLAQASGVAIELDLDALPLDDGVAEVARLLGRDPGAFAAGGGEDYELLVALSPEEAARDARLTVIGRVAEGAGLTLVGRGAAEDPTGWDHLDAGGRA